MRCRGGASPSRRRTGVISGPSIKRGWPPRFVIARRPQADVAISQFPAASWESYRRNRNCLPEIATAPLGPRNDTSGQRSNGNGAAHRIGGTTAASRTGLAVPAPTGPVRIERRPAYDPFFILHSSVFIIHYFIHPPAGDGKPYDKTSGNSLPFVQISPEPPDLSLTTGAFIDKIISENKGAVCPLQQARQPAKNLFVTHDPNTRDQYRRTTQWIKNASLP